MTEPHVTRTADRRPPVAVVIVGYNTRHLLGDCLKSLLEVSHLPLHVIYVDNRSADGSLDFVRDNFPSIEAIDSGGNLGYCGGNNVGLGRALESDAAFVLILNADTVTCNPAFVTSLVDYMLGHPKVGKVGPKVYFREHGVVQNTILPWPTIAGSFFSVLGKLLPGPRTAESEAVTVPTAVPSLNGCCILVRAEALRDVGLYDADFWCYVDEVDWDWRAERAGWQRHFVPVESIVHLPKAEGYDFASRTNYYIKRNTARWYAKTGKWISMAAWMAITLAIAAIRAVSAPFLGRSGPEYFRFVGRLAAGYAGVIADLVRGRLPTSSLSGPPSKKLLQDRADG